jgi:hypothetical protein
MKGEIVTMVVVIATILSSKYDSWRGGRRFQNCEERGDFKWSSITHHDVMLIYYFEAMEACIGK